MELPTARIVAPISDDNPLGYIVINESDLAEGMELYVEPVAPKSAQTKAA
ncbi:hypothetical protein [Sphingomonas sp. 10B4]|nr:hypothetical protein [Sphingomonas sp. 10B4]MDY7525494.1 hypothetical protein [Sphingomonas sp. 10B4]MEB0281438.1 hypothetical protein [Sphingomonas sp. 10B4]